MPICRFIGWANAVNKLYKKAYIDISDEEEKEIIEEELQYRKLKKKESKKKKKLSDSDNDDRDEEQDEYKPRSNQRDIKLTEKKLKKLANQSIYLKDMFKVPENLDFLVNNRKPIRMDENTKREIMRTRDVKNDPNVKIDGSHIIINLPNYARERGLEVTQIRRLMNMEEMNQIEQEAISHLKSLI